MIILLGIALYLSIAYSFFIVWVLVEEDIDRDCVFGWSLAWPLASLILTFAIPHLIMSSAYKWFSNYLSEELNK